MLSVSADSQLNSANDGALTGIEGQSLRLEDELASLEQLISKELPAKLEKILTLAGKETPAAKQVDGTVTELMGKIQELLDVLEYESAGKIARELENLLGPEGESALTSGTKSEAYELLANVEVIKLKLARQLGDPAANTVKARFLLKKAKDARF